MKHDNLRNVENDSIQQLARRFKPGREINYEDGSKDIIIQSIIYKDRVFVLVNECNTSGNNSNSTYKICEAFNEHGLELQKKKEQELLRELIPLFNDARASYVLEANSGGIRSEENTVEMENKESQRFIINSEVNKTDAGVKWMDDSINISLGLIDLLAKWSYESAINFDELPITLNSTLHITPSIPPIGGLANYGFDAWIAIGEFYDNAVTIWDRYKSNVSNNRFDPYYKHCSQYVQDFFDELGVFEATYGLCPYWMDDNAAAIGWYKTPLYQCQSKEEFRRFMIEFDKLLKRRYPNNNISVTIPEPEISAGGCYIATAVYGSYDCPQVWTLRRYRDFSLARAWYGRLFIRVYYVLSPIIVKLFGRHNWFRKLWKPWLDRKVEALNRCGFRDTPYDDRVW